MRQPAPTRQSSPPALPFHATAGEAGRCSASALAQPRHPSSAARRKLQPPPPLPPTTTKRQLRHRSRRLRCREHPRRRTRIGAARDALFGWATLPLSSFVSFLFQSPSNGLITMIAFHFLSGFGLIIADFIMTSIGGQTADTDADLRNFYYLFPAYCLGRGFFSLSTPPARLASRPSRSSRGRCSAAPSCTSSARASSSRRSRCCCRPSPPTASRPTRSSRVTSSPQWSFVSVS